MSFIRCIIFINISWATILLPSKYLLAQTITVPDPSFENAVQNSSIFHTWHVCKSTPDALVSSYYINNIILEFPSLSGQIC